MACLYPRRHTWNHILFSRRRPHHTLVNKSFHTSAVFADIKRTHPMMVTMVKKTTTPRVPEPMKSPRLHLGIVYNSDIGAECKRRRAHHRQGTEVGLK